MKDVLVFGTGKIFIENKNYIYEHYNIIGFIDNDVNKQGKMIDGRLIYSPLTIHQIEYEEILILSTSYFLDISNQLFEMHIPKDKINIGCLLKIINSKKVNYHEISCGEKNMNLYTKEFYDKQKIKSLESARIILPIVIKYLDDLDSVIDLGCGTGSWLAAFKELGASRILGVDGNYVNKSDLYIDPKEFLEYDLVKPLKVSQKFDLAMSLEVAEHLPEASAKVFVDSLCNHSDIILFSAAIPGQGGTNHINCQYPSYWAKLFKQRDYLCIDILRSVLWYDNRIEFFYRQNIMFYIKNNSKRMNDFMQKNVDLLFNPPLDVIHPNYFFSLMSRFWGC